MFKRHIMAESAEVPIFKCLRSCKNHLQQKHLNSNIPFDISNVCVSNTVDNDSTKSMV